MAFVISMLGWPDKSLPRDLIQGFQVQGLLPKRGALRPLTAQEIRRQQPSEGPHCEMGGFLAKEVVGSQAEEWI